MSVTSNNNNHLSPPPSWIRALAALARNAKDVRGRGRVAMWLHQRYGPSANWEWTVPYLDSFMVHLPGGALQSWITAFSGDYDPAERELLRTHIQPGSYVLDIGASYGLYTLPLAAAGRKIDASVIAIEPLPENIAVLRRNLTENGMGDEVRIIEVALGTTEGEVVLSPESGGGGNAAVEIAGSSMMFNKDRRTAPLRRLDDLDLTPASQRRCSLIKIDVEGFELDVLEGARRFLAEHRPVVSGEFHPDWLAERGYKREAAQSWAAANGYRAFSVALHSVNSWSDRRRVELMPITPGRWRDYPQLMLLPKATEARS